MYYGFSNIENKKTRIKTEKEIDSITISLVYLPPPNSSCYAATRCFAAGTMARPTFFRATPATQVPPDIDCVGDKDAIFYMFFPYSWKAGD
jgi:hypothetical protein